MGASVLFRPCLVALLFGLAMIQLQISTKTVNAQGNSGKVDICSGEGTFVSKKTFGWYVRCIFHQGIRRYLSYRKRCPCIMDQQWSYDERSNRCILGPQPTTTAATTTTTTTTEAAPPVKAEEPTTTTTTTTPAPPPSICTLPY